MISWCHLGIDAMLNANCAHFSTMESLAKYETVKWCQSQVVPGCCHLFYIGTPHYTLPPTIQITNNIKPNMQKLFPSWCIPLKSLWTSIWLFLCIFLAMIYTKHVILEHRHSLINCIACCQINVDKTYGQSNSNILRTFVLESIKVYIICTTRQNLCIGRPPIDMSL